MYFVEVWFLFFVFEENVCVCVCVCVCVNIYLQQARNMDTSICMTAHHSLLLWSQGIEHFSIWHTFKLMYPIHVCCWNLSEKFPNLIHFILYIRLLSVHCSFKFVKSLYSLYLFTDYPECAWDSTASDFQRSSVQFSSVQLLSRVWLFVDCSMPGLPAHHQLPEFTQTHVHWVGDASQPSHPLSSPSPAFNLSQHEGLFQ